MLTGPAGAGKTAVLTSVTRELGMSVQEWVNPIEQVNYNNERMFDDGSYSYQDTINYVSKTKQFKEWLRGSKYSSLSDGKGPNKVILIEDLPSQKTEELHDILDSYLSSKSKVPIVFIISESPTTKKSGSVKQVFPPQIIEKLRISTINFNPVTTTNMVKTMTRIATMESQRGARKFRVPDKMTLEHLAESVGGDIRAGINALQFSCLNDTSDLKQAFESVSKIASSKSKGGGKKTDNKVVSELSKIGGKDQGLVMFHALGKVLYAKREETFENQELPDHLKSNARKLLKSNPDEVLEKSTLSADAFNCFLHQNYFPFYSKLEDCQRLSEYFSLGDMFMNEWSHGGKVSLTEYGGLVGARATMFCNSAPNSSSGMRKLVKPEHYDAVRRLRQRTHDLQNIFQATPGRELVTSSLPLISRIRPPGLAAHKMATITEVGRFSGFKHVTVSNPGLIDQNDVFEEDEEADCEERKEDGDEENDVKEADDDEEEIVIEEFDD